MTTSNQFDRFDERLKLPRDEVEFARHFREVVEDSLGDGGIAIESTFLQGSLAKGTMIRPLKDVDLVVVLSRAAYSHLDVLSVFSLVSDALRAALASSYETLVVGNPKKYAIPIELRGDLPSFDVVPAFEDETETSDNILIGNTEDNRWESSNTREMMRAVASANQ